MTGVAALDKFKQEFFKATTFPDKMRIYADMREQYPEHADDLYLSPFIDYHFHQANDLPKFMPNAQLRQLTTQGTGKRELYYEIARSYTALVCQQIHTCRHSHWLLSP